MAPVTQADCAAMDDMASWAQANVPAIVKTEKPSPTLVQQAEAAHAAKRVRDDVGRYTPGLEYVSVYFAAIREYVTLGFSYETEEPGDDEQPTISEYVEIVEVWLRGVDIGPLTDGRTDELTDALKAIAKQASTL